MSNLFEAQQSNAHDEEDLDLRASGDEDESNQDDIEYTSEDVDEASEESFPASDAPSFNPGT